MYRCYIITFFLTGIWRYYLTTQFYYGVEVLFNQSILLDIEVLFNHPALLGYGGYLITQFYWYMEELTIHFYWDLEVLFTHSLFLLECRVVI